MGDDNDNDEKSSQKVSESAETPGCFELLIVTAKQMRKKKQFLLIPLTIWSGLEQGFFGADFTAVRYLFIRYLQNNFFEHYNLKQNHAMSPMRFIQVDWHLNLRKP